MSIIDAVNHFAHHGGIAGRLRRIAASANRYHAANGTASDRYAHHHPEGKEAGAAHRHRAAFYHTDLPRGRHIFAHHRAHDHGFVNHHTDQHTQANSVTHAAAYAGGNQNLDSFAHRDGPDHPDSKDRATLNGMLQALQQQPTLWRFVYLTEQDMSQGGRLRLPVGAE